jgi:hypothetical protein
VVGVGRQRDGCEMFGGERSVVTSRSETCDGTPVQEIRRSLAEEG